jgi:hypothetical protein
MKLCHWMFGCIATVGGTAFAGVLVVAPSGAPFTSIQAAVNASQNGDIVLVKAGNYGSFTIDGRVVSVVADAGATVTVPGQVVVRNLPAMTQIALVRLSVTGSNGTGPTNGAAIRLENNNGHIRVDGCTLRGGDGGTLSGCSVVGNADAAPALSVQRCADVAVSLGDLRGGNANNLFAFPDCDGTPVVGGMGGHGLFVNDSIVAVYDTSLKGGAGGTAWYHGGHGGDAMRIADLVPSGFPTNVLASNCSLDGSAKGGSAWDYIGGESAGFGGNAIEAAGPCSVRVLDCGPISGLGGCTLAGCLPLAPLYAISAPATLTQLSGPSKGFGMPRVLREGQNAQMLFSGSTGDAVFLLLSPTQQQFFAPAFKGVILLGSPLLGPYTLGNIDPSGFFSIMLPVPALPIGVDGIGLELQAILVAPSGDAVLTGAVHLTILDASF